MNIISRSGAVVLLAGMLISASAPTVLAQAPVDDGPGGMTCYYYVAAANLSWERDGGDWIDAEGQPYGDEPFAVENVPLAQGRQRISWDVTAFAKGWAASGDGDLAGLFFLRALHSSNGIVHFESRESLDVDARPVLSIEWDDGTSSRFFPYADAHFGCPTHRSSGAERRLHLSRRNAALLAFSLASQGKKKVNKALLTLTTDKQYASASRIGVFRPMMPWVKRQPVELGLASSYPFDRGLEENPDVLYVERYGELSGLSFPRLSTSTAPERVIDDPENEFEPFDGPSLKVLIKKGKNQGLNEHIRLSKNGREPEEAYFRYYLRFGENWNPSSGGGKLPGFSGTYDRAGWGGRRSDGTNGWSARGQFFGYKESSSALAALRGIGSYVYYGGMRSTYGEPWGWNLGPTGLLQKNRWYSIEQHVKLNTPGSSNGVFRTWVDGKLAFEKTGVDFRSVPDLKIESVWMNVYHGGTQPAPQDLVLYIDNVVVATSYIGPANTGRR